MHHRRRPSEKQANPGNFTPTHGSATNESLYNSGSTSNPPHDRSSKCVCGRLGDVVLPPSAPEHQHQSADFTASRGVDRPRRGRRGTLSRVKSTSISIAKSSDGWPREALTKAHVADKPASGFLYPKEGLRQLLEAADVAKRDNDWQKARRSQLRLEWTRDSIDMIGKQCSGCTERYVTCNRMLLMAGLNYQNWKRTAVAR